MSKRKTEDRKKADRKRTQYHQRQAEAVRRMLKWSNARSVK